jgi:hypothetical protein
MGSMSSRAGFVAAATGPFAIWLSGITDVSPNLPPQQLIDHQIQISGEICLAHARGHRVRTQHKKATARKQLEVAANQLAKLPLHAVSRYCGPDCLADNKAYLGRFVRQRRVSQQVPGHGWPSGTQPLTYGASEIRTPP